MYLIMCAYFGMGFFWLILFLYCTLIRGVISY